ncbi:uncharacterized protein LOC129925911 isoform X1 [Biomphalaria glabrata]|uniref:Uncharacterized protein LOC129925911 isoform X1 n=2 Tax=Biomphalaria glabrata TaxID=6526 RepID=A0A9W3A7W7_BIOGL|nr:uncharacterized protein LOC129925911 isoform X1 [Biomphalaria glabrata]
MNLESDIMALFYLVMTLFTWNIAVVWGFQSPVDHTRYQEGKKQYDMMQSQSEMPKYGNCWREAVMLIHSECKHLTDLVQARLALAYLNCFLEIQGRTRYECSGTSEIQSCLQNMNDADRSSFTTFFTHTQNICYFLQAQVWQEETEYTINKLSVTSSQVADQLETSQVLQKDMLASQNQSLKNQEELINQAHSLNDIIINSSHSVKFLFEDLKQSTKEQRQIIGDLFDQLTKLQNTILGEVSGFYSLVYYMASIFVCYILSSTPRTAGSRVWLFLIMTLNVLTEQTIMRWINNVYSTSGDNEFLYWLQKMCRRISMAVAIISWLLCAYLYKDINALNNQLLVEIRKQNSDLKKLFTGQPVPPKPEQTSTVNRHTEDSTDSDYTSDVSDEDDSDDSDKTFILPENRKDNDELASWLTLQDSEHLEKEKASLLIELSELQKDTSLTDPHEKILSWLDKANTSLEYIDFKPSPLSVPVTQTTNSGSPYNLRPRKQTNSPSISPVTRVESAKSFSKTVYHMHQIAEKNSRLVRALNSTSPCATVSPQTLVLDDRSCKSSTSNVSSATRRSTRQSKF